MIRRSIRTSSFATLAGLVVHFSGAYIFGWPLLTDAVAEWVMARTPSSQALWLLANLGPWAKPFAATAGLALLGFLVWVALLPPALRSSRSSWAAALAVASAGCAGLAATVDYPSVAGVLSFLAPAIITSFAIAGHRQRDVDPERRRLLSIGGRVAAPLLMTGGVAAVAIESFLRNAALGRASEKPITLFSYSPPEDTFGEGLVRSPVTPIGKFYTMSKNTVDPALDPDDWRLRVTVDGEVLSEYRYDTLLSLPRRNQYVSLRCVSNNLASNLMGNALWTGLDFEQLVEPADLPSGIVEAAVIGTDGHGDSLPLDYAFSRATLLALGMNGQTLNRAHGFPVRLLAPRYYGFKHVKWIGEIAFRSQPYFGTWPKMGYTRKPIIHTVSFIDKARDTGSATLLGGIAMSGHGGIKTVTVRADETEWHEAEIERPLSPFAWTRWKAELPTVGAAVVEARAMDARGRWQAAEEGPLFPDGVKGPTIRRIM